MGLMGYFWTFDFPSTFRMIQKGLFLERLPRRAVLVESDFFVKVDVVRQDEYLLDVTTAGTHIFKGLTNQTSDDEKNVAVQTGYRIIEDNHPVCGDTGR